MAMCNFCGGPAKEIQRCPRCDTSDAAPPVLTTEEVQTLRFAARKIRPGNHQAANVLENLSLRLTGGTGGSRE